MEKRLLVLIVSFVLVFGLGIYAGTKIKKSSAPQGSENSYQAGWDAAQKRLEETGLGGPKMDNIEIKTISGTIEKIESNKVTLKANPISALADPSLDTRIITISGDTKIFQLSQKDPAQSQKEMEEFSAKMRASVESKEPSSETLVPPTLEEKKQVQLSDLKVGQQVTVTSSEDVKTKKEFVAVEISMQVLPIAPVMTENNPIPAPAVDLPTTAAGNGAPPAPVVPQDMPAAPPMPVK